MYDISRLRVKLYYSKRNTKLNSATQFNNVSITYYLLLIAGSSGRAV